MMTTTATAECSSHGADQKYCTIDFEETELRLGLAPPHLAMGTQATASVSTKNAADSESTVKINTGKRGFSDTVDLKLNLSSSSTLKDDGRTSPTLNATKPPAKAQVVGWPPVRSFRKNIMSVQKSGGGGGGKEGEISGGGAAFVKVSLDGAPYLRKVDLKLYKSYTELSDALTRMFSSFTIIGNCGSQGMKDFMNESKLIDLLNGSDYVPTYEDKDGDWMLVGDVPWEMFVNSCKRLRIMKGSEAIGLAPRAIEKCKNRS